MLDISLHTVVGLTLFVLYAISVLGLVLVILLENRNPLKTISWVIVLLTLPGIGLVFISSSDRITVDNASSRGVLTNVS